MEFLSSKIFTLEFNNFFLFSFVKKKNEKNSGKFSQFSLTHFWYKNFFQGWKAKKQTEKEKQVKIVFGVKKFFVSCKNDLRKFSQQNN